MVAIGENERAARGKKRRENERDYLRYERGNKKNGLKEKNICSFLFNRLPAVLIERAAVFN